MGADLMPYRRTGPCAECPWRRDAPPGKFPACRYDALRATTGRAGAEVPLGAPLFACHMTDEGREQPCAGWLAAAGIENLTIRVAIAMGRLPAEVLKAGVGWPALYGSYDELAAANGAAEEQQR